MIFARQWVRDATTRLESAGIPTARLDAELLLCDVLQKDRTWLIANSDEVISRKIMLVLDRSLTRRVAREPLAYIRGYKEFYGRNFAVTTDTLIPRPDTEALIEVVKKLSTHKRPAIHDVGTGSGCIPITLALELPHARVSGSDVSHAALEIARKNAQQHGAESVGFYKDNLLERAPDSYDIVTANLPYVDPSWETSPETAYEPSLALFADDNGLGLIKQLIKQAPDHLVDGGYLILEADPRQHDAIIAFGHSHSFDWRQTDGFIVVLVKR